MTLKSHFSHHAQALSQLAAQTCEDRSTLQRDLTQIRGSTGATDSTCSSRFLHSGLSSVLHNLCGRLAWKIDPQFQFDIVLEAVCLPASLSANSIAEENTCRQPYPALAALSMSLATSEAFAAGSMAWRNVPRRTLPDNLRHLEDCIERRKAKRKRQKKKKKRVANASPNRRKCICVRTQT